MRNCPKCGKPNIPFSEKPETVCALCSSEVKPKKAISKKKRK